MANETPLEKQLLQLDLSAGIDESASPEVGGSMSRLITKMDNLVQVEQGAWVQRDGITQLGATTDELGTAIGAPLAGVRTIGGLGLIANKAGWYNYSEATGNFRRSGQVSEFSVTGQPIASSAAASQKLYTGQRILTSASNTDYDVIVYEGVKTSDCPVPVMVIYDRAAGIEVVRYVLSDIMTDLTSTKLPTVRVVFVADRYLHIFMHNSDDAGGLIQYAYHDASAVWPSAPSGLSAIDNDVTGNATSYIADVIAGPDRAFLVISGITNDACISMSNAGALLETATIAAFDAHSGGIDTIATPLIWLVGKNTAGTKVRVYAVPYNNIDGAATYDWTDATADVDELGLVVFPTGKIGVLTGGTLTTFGGTTIPNVTYWETTAPGDTTLVVKANIWGWVPYSNPFYLSATEKAYVHFQKYTANEAVAPHVVACLSDITSVSDPQGTTQDVETVQFKSFRLAAILEPMFGYSAKKAGSRKINDNTVTVRQRYIPRSTTEMQMVVPYQAVARSATCMSYTLGILDKTVYNSAQFGTASYVSGGYITQHENFRPHEVGFADFPVLNVADSVSGGNPDGSYNYVAVYRGVGPSGELTWSRTYGPQSVTVATNKVTVNIQPLAITDWENGVYGDNQVVVDVYRTISGGTQYFLVGSSQSQMADSNTDAQQISMFVVSGRTVYQLTDDLSDASLANNPIMHRQAGTNGAALDRYPPPASNIVKRHKDRIFVADPYGQRVYYSSFFVESESAWFSPAFSFQCHGGSGPIMAIESMDGRLIVFKKDAVFVVDGDGPPENGGNGTEFAPPQRLAVEFGCISTRSTVVVPDGILYRSARGFERLNRSLQNEFLGAKVKTTAAAYPTTLGAILDVNTGSSMARWLVTDGDVTRELVYDLSHDCWSTSTFVTDTMRHLVTADLEGEHVVYMNAAKVFRNDPDTGLEDAMDFMPAVVETGFIRPSGPQGRHRLHGISVLGKMQSYHSMAMSLAFDYSDTYTQTKVWEPDVLFEETQEVTMNSVKGQPIATRVKIELGSPADPVTYPLTTGKGLKLLGIALEVAQKKGPQGVWWERKG